MTNSRAALWEWIKTHAHSDADAQRAVNLVKDVIAEAPQAVVRSIIKKLHRPVRRKS